MSEAIDRLTGASRNHLPLAVTAAERPAALGSVRARTEGGGPPRRH